MLFISFKSLILYQ